MRKTILFTMLIMALLAVPASAQNTGINYHEIEIKDEYGSKVSMDDIQFLSIRIPASETAQTIYQERTKTTTISQPIREDSTNTTLVNSRLSWWGPNSFDLRIQYKGRTINKTGMNSSSGSVIIGNAFDDEKSTIVDFDAQPLVVQEDGTAASGVDTEVNVMNTGGSIFEYININTQTILVPNIVGTGLDIARDLTDTDGTEFTEGILASSNSAHTVGTAGGFYLRVKVYITDVSGTDDFAIGFRKAEAYQAAVDDYDEMAAFNIISGNVYTETIINAAGTVSTDTTENWADLAAHTVQINVSDAGVVTYMLDGVAPATTVAYTFDDAEVIVPFIYLIHDSDLANATILQDYRCGIPQ